MISREEFRTAVSAAGGNAAAAELLGSSVASVERWKAGGVPELRQGLVQERMRKYLPGGPAGAGPLDNYSDLELVAQVNALVGELASRLGQATNLLAVNDPSDSAAELNGTGQDGSSRQAGKRGRSRLANISGDVDGDANHDRNSGDR